MPVQSSWPLRVLPRVAPRPAALRIGGRCTGDSSTTRRSPGSPRAGRNGEEEATPDRRVDSLEPDLEAVVVGHDGLTIESEERCGFSRPKGESSTVPVSPRFADGAGEARKCLIPYPSQSRTCEPKPRPHPQPEHVEARRREGTAPAVAAPAGARSDGVRRGAADVATGDRRVVARVTRAVRSCTRRPYHP